MKTRCSAARGRWLGLSACWFLAAGQVFAADQTQPKELRLPPAFEKAVPETVKDLQDIQKHVRTLLDRTLRCTVGIRIGAAQGSGVIISKDGYVLTAGHVSGTPDRNCKIILPDGRVLNGKTLGANRGIDSGLIKITDEGDYPFCEMAQSADVKKGHWCLAIGHPGGVQAGRSPVVRLGRILEASKSFVRTDCTLVGGDSGGPLFDMTGKVIGIHSRIGGPITANIHVPVDTYRETWDRLAKGEEWGNLFGMLGKASDAYLGLSLDQESKDCKIVNVSPNSPAEKAGLMANDIVRGFDGKKVASAEDLIKLMQGKRPGNEVPLEIQRGVDTINVRVTLGKRPV